MQYFLRHCALPSSWRPSSVSPNHTRSRNPMLSLVSGRRGFWLTYWGCVSLDTSEEDMAIPTEDTLTEARRIRGRNYASLNDHPAVAVRARRPTTWWEITTPARTALMPIDMVSVCLCLPCTVNVTDVPTTTLSLFFYLKEMMKCVSLQRWQHTLVTPDHFEDV